MRSNSSGTLYPFHGDSMHGSAALSLTMDGDLWHKRLGHPGRAALSRLSQDFLHLRNNAKSVCSTCQLGRQPRLPFSASQHCTTAPFQIIHCDLWTSPVASFSGYQYYLIVLDDFSHYSWSFPLRCKSDTSPTLQRFFQYVLTQFNVLIKCLQCDNGGEFINSSLRTYFSNNGITFRLSCPYTSPQNGKAERLIRSTNDILRTLLIQANFPPAFWVESLHTATYLLNRRPSSPINFLTPFYLLFGVHPTYDHLRAFGCLCFPNTYSTSPHKLAPRSVRCVFIGYPLEHKGYRCLDLHSRRVFISRHVVFDESSFPYTAAAPTNTQQTCSPDPPHQPHLIPLGPPAPPTSSFPNRSTPGHSSPFPHVVSPDQSPLSPASRRAPPSPPVPPPLSSPLSPTNSRSASPAARPSPPSAAQLPIGSSSPSVDTTSPSPPASLFDAPASPGPPTPCNSQLPPKSIPVAPPDNTHTMRTRSKSGYFMPKQDYSLTVSATISPIPATYKAALKDPHWHNAMLDEYNALMQNDTWSLVPCPAGVNVVTGKWIYRHKLHPDGSLARYKARWVLRGFTQREGVDYDETFSPVVKPATIRVVLSLATSKDWPMHQLDVKNAFLHGHLQETVYCQQPSGFVDSTKPSHVCRLHKSLYGLKQAPRTWFHRFTTFLHTIGFVASKCDSSLFTLHHGTSIAYLLLYVDDIILTANTPSLLNSIITSLKSEFSMSDLGDIHHFLGINVHRNKAGLFLSQQQYALEILDRARMLNCNPISTPIDTRSKLSSTAGQPYADPSHYRSLAGALQYLTLTRPDLSYAVQQVCLFMHAPHDGHFQLLKRILRYVRGTTHLGLQLYRSSTHDLTAYSDADWAGCPDTRKSTSGFCVFLGDNIVSWSSKRQHTVSRSSAEAEYRAVANCVAESTWLRQLLTELRLPPSRATVVYCDNVSAMYLSSNPVQHQRTKHVEIDLHFVRDRVNLGEARVLHVPTTSQFADIFTKGLPSAVFTEFRSSLNVKSHAVATAGAC